MLKFLELYFGHFFSGYKFFFRLQIFFPDCNPMCVVLHAVCFLGLLACCMIQSGFLAGRRIFCHEESLICYFCCYVDLESAEELYQRRITRILTSDFPKYFVIVTRIRHDTVLLGPDGGLMSSRVNPQVQAVFPPTALTKPIKVGLQVIKT